MLANWSLAAGRWFLGTGRWSLVAGGWSLASGIRLSLTLDTRCSILDARYEKQNTVIPIANFKFRN